MTLTNNRHPIGITAPLKSKTLDKSQCGFRVQEDDSLNFFIGIDLNKCIEEDNIIYHLLQEMLVEKLDMPIRWIKPVLQSDQNTFGAAINVVEQNDIPSYYIGISAVIGNKQFDESYCCQPSPAEQRTWDVLVKGIKQAFEDGKVCKVAS